MAQPAAPQVQPGGLLGAILGSLGSLGANVQTEITVNTASVEGRTAKVGQPVQATLVYASPSASVAGQDMMMLVLSVTTPAGAATQMNVSQNVPPQARHLLVPGTVLPARMIEVPGFMSTVTVDWAAAMAGGPSTANWPSDAPQPPA
jgi:hypothetical protein